MHYSHDTDFKKCIIISSCPIGIGSYNGLMEDMYLYTQALTERLANVIIITPHDHSLNILFGNIVLGK